MNHRYPNIYYQWLDEYVDRLVVNHHFEFYIEIASILDYPENKIQYITRNYEYHLRLLYEKIQDAKEKWKLLTKDNIDRIWRNLLYIEDRNEVEIQIK